jgi:hypothetical protein
MRYVLLVCMLGCSRPTLDHAPFLVSATNESVPPKPAPIAKRADVLLRIERDLDGDEVTLDADGVLRAGKAKIRVELARNEYFFPLQSALTSVAVHPGVNAILFTEPTEESEDPPNRYRLFRKSGGDLELVLDRVIGTYGVTPLTFSGKGTASYIEDSWTACERAKYPPFATIHEVTLQFDGTARFLGDTRAPTKKAQNCKQLAG